MSHDAEYWITEIEKNGGHADFARLKGKPSKNEIIFRFQSISDKHPSKDPEPRPQREPGDKCQIIIDRLKKDGWTPFPPKNSIDIFVIPASEGWITIASSSAIMNL